MELEKLYLLNLFTFFISKPIINREFSGLKFVYQSYMEMDLGDLLGRKRFLGKYPFCRRDKRKSIFIFRGQWQGKKLLCLLYFNCKSSV